MKKIALSFILLSSIAFANTEEVSNYKKGYEVAIGDVKEHITIEGVYPKILNLVNKNIVLINISELPTAEILYTRNILRKENIKTYITSKHIVSEGFERLADAKATFVKIRKLGIMGGELVKNNQVIFITEPLFTNEIIKALEEDNKTVFIKYVEVNTNNKANTLKNITTNDNKTTKFFKLKYEKAQAYTLKGSDKKSVNFTENYVANNGKYRFDGEVITEDKNEQFIKVLNKNIYFLKKDILE